MPKRKKPSAYTSHTPRPEEDEYAYFDEIPWDTPASPRPPEGSSDASSMTLQEREKTDVPEKLKNPALVEPKKTPDLPENKAADVSRKRHGKIRPKSSGVEPFSEEDYQEVERNQKRRKDALFQLEQKLHSVKPSPRTKVSFWCNPLMVDMARIMADQLGIGSGEVVEQALLSFYRNQLTPERSILSDIVLNTDQLALLVSEHTHEMLNFEELAWVAMDAEKSPLQGMPGEEDEDV